MLGYLLTLLAGAGSSLAAAAFIQMRVIPHVEARKRREDRWERDVRALGELLAYGFADAIDNVHAALIVQVLTSARRDDLPENELLELRSAQEDRMFEARRGFDREYYRITWLADQISKPGERHSNRQLFDSAMTRFLIATRDMQEAGAHKGQLRLAEAEAVSTAMVAATDELKDAVRRMSWNGPPVRPGTAARATGWVCRVLWTPVRTARRRAALAEDARLLERADRALCSDGF